MKKRNIYIYRERERNNGMYIKRKPDQAQSITNPAPTPDLPTKAIPTEIR